MRLRTTKSLKSDLRSLGLFLRFFVDCFFDDEGVGSDSLSELSELPDETDRFAEGLVFDIFGLDLAVDAFGGAFTIGRFGKGFFLDFDLSALL